MKISLITVCYNSAATIADTLRSVAGQSHAEMEYLVIDGGSSDGTQALVRDLAPPGTILVSEPDLGIYDAMNKGVARATGDLVGFLNADDVLSGSDVLRRVAGCATAQPGVDVVYGDLVYVSLAQPERVIRYWRSGTFAPSRLRFGWMAPHPALYVRREFLQATGGFDTRFRIAADYDLMLRLLRQPGLRVRYLPEVLVRMRIGGASNRSLRAVLRKSWEDWQALRRNRAGGLLALLCKNFRKLPQFLGRR